MPCQSEYLEPNDREKESRKVARLLIYVHDMRGWHAPAHIRHTASQTYGSPLQVHELTALLCRLCTRMTKEQQDAIIYNARKPLARELADWWEAHQAHDKARAKREKAEAEVAALRESALAKLTKKERAALNLPHDFKTI